MTKLLANTDGGSRGNPGPAAAGILIRLDDQEIFKGGKYLGEATNNIAEYQALVLAVNWIIANSANYKFSEVEFILDSELIVKQLTGEYKVKDEKMKALFNNVTARLVSLKVPYTFKHVLRSENKVADKMVNTILDKHSR